MGIDLALMIVQPGAWFAHTTLELDRHYDLFDVIVDIECKYGREVPENFVSYRGTCAGHDEPCYGPTKTTPYGEPLRCVRLKELLHAFEIVDMKPKYCLTAAARDYLYALPDDWDVALYWH